MHFEDFSVGQMFETGHRTLSEQEITEFAQKWDWQYFHADAEAAKASPYGGLIASGFHTLLTAFTLTLDRQIWQEGSMGSPGMDTIRWLEPVRPGDTLSVVVEVTGVRPSRSKPDRGVVTFHHEVRRQDETVVMVFESMVMVARRPL
ncbi:MAG: MaoC family dehydratase [Pseudomonadota bacterium]